MPNLPRMSQRKERWLHDTRAGDERVLQQPRKRAREKVLMTSLSEANKDLSLLPPFLTRRIIRVPSSLASGFIGALHNGAESRDALHKPRCSALVACVARLVRALKTRPGCSPLKATAVQVNGVQPNRASRGRTAASSCPANVAHSAAMRLLGLLLVAVTACDAANGTREVSSNEASKMREESSKKSQRACFLPNGKPSFFLFLYRCHRIPLEDTDKNRWCFVMCDSLPCISIQHIISKQVIGATGKQSNTDRMSGWTDRFE